MWDKIHKAKGINQDKCIEGKIYVQMSEMKEKYARFQIVHIQKYVDR